MNVQVQQDRNIWNLPWFIIPVLVAFSVGVILKFSMPYGAEILALNSWRMEPFNSFFRFITKLGETYPFVVAILLGLFWRYRASLLILLAGIVVMPYAWVLKDQFAVTRPLNWLGDMGLRDQLVVVPHVELASGFTSFPSGHTIAAFTLYSLLALILSEVRPIYGLFCAVLAILVGFSRIFLAQHFLTDVLGGVVFGLILGSLVWQIGKWKVFRENVALDGNLRQSFKK
jgi:membrane-associated phospholipid phosphatase